MLRGEVRDKILRRCKGLVSVATHSLASPTASATTRVFYNRMLGTIFRYLMDFSKGVASYQCEDLAAKHFKIAIDIAKREARESHS